jgi:hypothetical protein
VLLNRIMITHPAFLMKSTLLLTGDSVIDRGLNLTIDFI